MILPDVNILVYAHDSRGAHHDAARAWWDDALSGDEPVALTWMVILGFVRLSTSRRMFEEPVQVQDAAAAVEAWLAQPHVRIVHPGRRHHELLFGFIRSAGVAGNLTMDAHLAALAVEHGATVFSVDTDFARFPDLDWRNPLAPPSNGASGQRTRR